MKLAELQYQRKLLESQQDSSSASEKSSPSPNKDIQSHIAEVNRMGSPGKDLAVSNVPLRVAQGELPPDYVEEEDEDADDEDQDKGTKQ